MILTPKQKAKELVDRFQKQIFFHITDERSDINEAKGLALIAIDELIEFEKRIVSQIENIAMLNGHKFKREELYYESVKQEIKKL